MDFFQLVKGFSHFLKFSYLAKASYSIFLDLVAAKYFFSMFIQSLYYLSFLFQASLAFESLVL